jgi:hypothetical protein
LLIQELADVKVKELNRNLKHLIIIKFHHHQHVLESRIADLNALIVAVDCNLEPCVLGFEKL